MKPTLVCVMLAMLLQGHIQAQIVSGPTTQTVFNGEIAVFNCSLNCSYQTPVTWYFTLPSNLRTGFVSPYTMPSTIKAIYGIDVSRRSVNECSQGGYVVEQFFVTASKPLNLMPVQCFTLSDGSCGAKIQAYFSIAALLHVIDAVPTIASTSTYPSSSLYLHNTEDRPVPTRSTYPSSSLYLPTTLPVRPVPTSLPLRAATPTPTCA